MKSIAQTYDEKVRSIPIKSGRPDPRATSRLKSRLHQAFWRPVADILDPLDRSTKPGSAGKALFERGNVRLTGNEMQESLVLMKSYLGVTRLSFGTWLHMWRIFRDLLKDALNYDGMDVVMCVVVEFLRLELGQQADPNYGKWSPNDPATRPFNDEEWSLDDEIFWAQLGGIDNDPGWGSLELKLYCATGSWQKSFDDPAKFDEKFPGMGHRRSNMMQALRPVFDLDWIEDSETIHHVGIYVDKLLAVQFDENRRPPTQGELSHAA